MIACAGLREGNRYRVAGSRNPRQPLGVRGILPGMWPTVGRGGGFSPYSSGRPHRFGIRRRSGVGPMAPDEESGTHAAGAVQVGRAAATEKVSGAVRKASGRATAGERTPSPQNAVVTELPDGVKQCYLGVLVWLVHFGDGRIDDREFCEIQVLMTQLRCGPDVRCAVRSYLEEPQRLEAEAQVARMLELVRAETADTTPALRCSLITDAIRILRAAREDNAREQPAVRRLAAILALDDRKVPFIKEACVQEDRILAGEVSDFQIADAAMAMAAQAAGVGVPIATVYLSGSVTGLSAAGTASGLAALGLGGVLGLSAMVTGIGTAILAAGAAYHGVRWGLAGSVRSRASRRELMLQEVLRIHQRAIINLGEDMSVFGKRIAVLSRGTDNTRGTIDRLSQEVALMSRSAGALTRLGERASRFEKDIGKEAAVGTAE